MATAQEMLATTRAAIESMTVVDWLLAIALLVAIVVMVTWLYAHQNGDGPVNAMMEEGFIDRGARGRANRAELLELFETQEKGPKKLGSMADVKNLGDRDVVVLLIHHTQCGHCKNFMPMWTRLCQKYQSSATGDKTITLYDISNDDNEALWSAASDRFGVEGYPTVLFLKKVGDKVEHSEYMGPRDEYAVWCSYIERQCAE